MALTLYRRHRPKSEAAQHHPADSRTADPRRLRHRRGVTPRSRQDRFRAAVQLRAGVHAERRSQRLPRSVDAARRRTIRRAGTDLDRSAGTARHPIAINRAPVETIVIDRIERPLEN
jgi:hypothetical protein